MQNSYNQFEVLISQMFKLMNYEVKIPKPILSFKDKGFDLELIGGKRVFVEIKFYRSTKVSNSLIRSASENLLRLVLREQGVNGILVTSSIVSLSMIQEVKTQFGIDVWDRPILLDNLEKLSADLKQQFELILFDAQQGTETYNMLAGSDIGKALSPISLSGNKNLKSLSDPIEKEGEKFRDALKNLVSGKATWSLYEELMMKILKFLFDEDLSRWDKQSRTDDGLSRFDLICRIKAFDDYWKALIASFSTRYVLFEFKNYSDKITQNQIFTTERYLYNKALRSVAFVICRKGGTTGAELAAKGALKENGKLILLLSDEDIDRMLEIKDNDGNASDYLADKLDDWLISLSR